MEDLVKFDNFLKSVGVDTTTMPELKFTELVNLWMDVRNVINENLGTEI